MKIKRIIVLILYVLMFSASIAAGGEAPGSFPIAVLPEQLYTFEPVLEGTEVAHDFILQNKGNAPLDIINLKSG